LDYIAASASHTSVIEEDSKGMVIRTPYTPNLSNRLLLKYGEHRFALLRKIISGFYENAQFLINKGPKVGLYKEARKFLKTNSVDAIIATGDPFVLFKYASQLSTEFNIPWVADYRDPWSQSFSAKKGFLQRQLDRFYERRIVKKALCITTVDELFKVKLKQLFASKKIDIISNGYDPEEMNRTNGIEQNKDCLTFSFVGTIYKWHPIDSLLKAFSDFQNNAPLKEFKIKFYGVNDENNLKAKIRNEYRSLEGKIAIIPRTPNGTLLELLAKDNVMLLFNYYQFTGTKIYDYLGLQRKILLCFTEDDDANRLKQKFYFKSIETSIQPQIDMLEQTNSGIVVKNQKHLIQVLTDLFNEFENTGQIACHSTRVENYSRKIQVQKLAEIIKGIETPPR
jgi:glycosyltransferase involved in cell wall biosynthesis